MNTITLQRTQACQTDPRPQCLHLAFLPLWSKYALSLLWNISTFLRWLMPLLKTLAFFFAWYITRKIMKVKSPRSISRDFLLVSFFTIQREWRPSPSLRWQWGACQSRPRSKSGTWDGPWRQQPPGQHGSHKKKALCVGGFHLDLTGLEVCR